MSELPTSTDIARLERQFSKMLDREYPETLTEEEETADDVFERGMRDGFALAFRGMCGQAFLPNRKGRQHE